MKRLFCAAAVIVTMALIPQITLGAAPFYEGKTIRIMVGVSAGGGFDNEARILARHMPKYIPGIASTWIRIRFPQHLHMI